MQPFLPLLAILLQLVLHHESVLECFAISYVVGVRSPHAPCLVNYRRARNLLKGLLSVVDLIDARIEQVLVECLLDVFGLLGAPLQELSHSRLRDVVLQDFRLVLQDLRFGASILRLQIINRHLCEYVGAESLVIVLYI